MSALSHAIRRARRSIAVRLSLMLLAVFVVMLAAIGVHFYGVLGSELASRAQTELFGKTQLVQRALHELPSARDIAAHSQHFDDILIGQHRLFLAILDIHGVVLHQSAAFDMLDPALLGRLREQALLGREGDLERRSEDKFLARTEKGWIGADEAVWIAIATDARDYGDLVTTHGKAMLVALLLGAAVATVGGIGMLRSGLAPVRRLAAAEERVSAGHLGARIEIDDTPLELERLAQSFNSMLDRLDDSFRRLSEFSSDLAHELRTPINSLIGHAHVALSRPRSAEEYAVALESIAEDGERVARIVRDMLFLAQADNATAVLRKERLDLRAELETVVAYFDVLANEQGVAFVCDGRAEVWADQAMVQRAISNLLSNALWHTSRGETVFVKIRSGDAGSVSLEVRNPGPGIPAEHLPRIFDRFYQTDATRRDDATGTGLGLAIVKSIMDLHGGSVDATSAPGELTTFRLKFEG
ncbi:MAG: heavy metal sensor histidine kinase [Betaproteobacteria bacterium]|nr:heavy metal sensor histidine kinase [Betaproteobacteria bacterium]